MWIIFTIRNTCLEKRRLVARLCSCLPSSRIFRLRGAVWSSCFGRSRCGTGSWRGRIACPQRCGLLRVSMIWIGRRRIIMGMKRSGGRLRSCCRSKSCPSRDARCTTAWGLMRIIARPGGHRSGQCRLRRRRMRRFG